MNPPATYERVIRELPPRHLDWFTRAVVLLGDFISQTGWGLLAVGSVFFWTTAVNSEVKFYFQEKSIDWDQKAGVVLQADSTAGMEQNKRIWKYRHSFAHPDGYRYFGTSYSVGKKFDAGQIAFIRFDPGHPETNYITGLRRSEYSWRVNLLLLIPFFGLLLAAFPIRQNSRHLRLLKIGDFTRGQLESKTATGQSVKKGAQVLPVFKYRFRFAHNGIIYFASCRTHQPSLVEDEVSEIILFDRYNPAFNLVYDAVPNLPHINAAGKMEPMPALKSWILLLPVFTVVVNIIFAMLTF